MSSNVRGGVWMDEDSSKKQTSSLTFIFAVQSLLSFRHRVVTGQSVLLWVLKPLEKSVEIKKDERTNQIFLSRSSQTRFSTFKVCLCIEVMYKPGTCEFFTEWKFLHVRCYFWCRLNGISCWLATVSRCSVLSVTVTKVWLDPHGSLANSVPTMKVAGKLWCGLNSLSTTKGSFRCSWAVHPIWLFNSGALAYLSVLTISRELWILY